MRQIYTINAIQVVTSESHPEGVKSNVTGYPNDIDSMNYASDEIALIVAQADYANVVKQLSLANNRAMWTVTLTRADGRQIDRKSWGSFPAEPEPEEEPSEETEGEGEGE